MDQSTPTQSTMIFHLVRTSTYLDDGLSFSAGDDAVVGEETAISLTSFSDAGVDDVVWEASPLRFSILLSIKLCKAMTDRMRLERYISKSWSFVLVLKAWTIKCDSKLGNKLKMSCKL